MRTQVTLPTPTEIRDLLIDDPLRKMTHRARTQKLSNTIFTKNLLRRVEIARWEPRIAESVIEKMALFAELLDLKQIIIWCKTSYSPQSLGALIDFSCDLFADDRHSNLVLLQNYLRSHYRHPKNHTMQSFYLGHTRGPNKRVWRILFLENLSNWERWGFYAQSAPYSKELLSIYKTPHNSISKTTIKNQITLWLKESLKFKFFTLEDIYRDLNVPLSKRQFSRYLNAHENIRRVGDRKATRYAARLSV